MHIKKLLIFCLAILLTASNFSLGINTVFASDDNNVIVYIPDSNLKQALVEKGADANGDGNITRGEMAALADVGHFGTGLANLDFSNKGITDITGLEYAINVRTIGLTGNNITDISPLSKLVNLEALTLDQTNVKDISPIVNLPKLALLSMNDMPGCDISAFAYSYLPSLRFLYLGNANLNDISSLSKLTTLTILSISINNISDLSPLKNITGLRELHASSNAIKDISALANMPFLSNLQIYNNVITDISPISNLKELRTVDFNNNEINSISALSQLNKIYLLSLANNNISDISPLRNLNALEALTLYDNDITNLEALSNLTKLRDLNLGFNEITDISPLANLISLQYLFLGNNKIININSLNQLHQLKKLWVFDNQISDISVLANFTNLDTLYLLGNKITDISVLKALTQLRYVDITEDHLTVPSVTGVEDGKVYHTARTIKFDHGRAALKNLDLNWSNEDMGYGVVYDGDVVDRNGTYILIVDDDKGNVIKINFTIDLTTSKVKGVENGKIYNTNRIIYLENINATLNGIPISNGTEVNEDGKYTLVLTEASGESLTINFELNKSASVVTGVVDGETYSSAVTISFDEGTATLDYKPFASGTTVSKNGVYTLIVTNSAGESTIINFRIYSAMANLIFEENDYPSDWATVDIQEANNRGLLAESTKYGYKKHISRERFCELIIKAVEAITGKSPEELLKERGKELSDNPFIDTSNNNIISAYHLGIINGKSPNTFEPETLLLRKEAAVILMRAAGKALGLDTSESKIMFTFNEVIDEWAIEGVNYGVATGIMNGIGYGKFDPNGTFTVEQAILTVLRLYNKCKNI